MIGFSRMEKPTVVFEPCGRSAGALAGGVVVGKDARVAWNSIRIPFLFGQHRPSPKRTRFDLVVVVLNCLQQTFAHMQLAVFYLRDISRVPKNVVTSSTQRSS